MNRSPCLNQITHREALSLLFRPKNPKVRPSLPLFVAFLDLNVKSHGSAWIKSLDCFGFCPVLLITISEKQPWSLNTKKCCVAV